MQERMRARLCNVGTPLFAIYGDQSDVWIGERAEIYAAPNLLRSEGIESCAQQEVDHERVLAADVVGQGGPAEATELLAVARYLPSELKATALTSRLWPLSRCRSFPDSGSQNRTSPKSMLALKELILVGFEGSELAILFCTTHLNSP